MGYPEKIKAAITELEEAYPGCNVVVWFHDGATTAKVLPGTRWIKQERKELVSESISPRSWHYEAHVILEGRFEYRHPAMKSQSDAKNYIGASEGASFDWDNRTFTFTIRPQFKTTNWMSNLPGDTAVNTLTLPGSHCSSAVEELTTGADLDATPNIKGKKATNLVKMNTCQYDDIGTQLKNGVRLLDLRVGPAFKINQGPYKLFKSFVTVLDEVEVFLKANQSETVLVRVDWLSNSVHLDTSATKGSSQSFVTSEARPPASFANELKKIVQARGSTIYSSTAWPRLSDVRGKMVFLRGFESEDKSWGLELLVDKMLMDFVVRTSEKIQQQPDNVKTLEVLRKEKYLTVSQSYLNYVMGNLTSGAGIVRPTSLSIRVENDTLDDDENWIVPSITAPWMQEQALGFIAAIKGAAPYLWVFSDFIRADLAVAIAKLNFNLEP